MSDSRGGRRATSDARALPEDVIDFDLHGLIRLRLVGASPGDVERVFAQLGPLQRGPTGGDPDLCVRFVPELSTDGLRQVEAGRTGYTDEGFLVLAHGKRRAGARVALETLDAASEIVCDRGSGPIPLLLDLLRLAALRRGVLPLHASAFDHDGNGILVLGWAHSGKSSTLLAFAQHGARFVGDDLVFLAGDGLRMFGLHAPLDVAEWQLRQIPRLWSQVGPGRRMLSASLRGLGRLERRLPQAGELSGARQLTRRLIEDLQRRQRSRLPVEVLFPGSLPAITEPKKVFLTIAHEAADVRVEPADPEEMLRRVIQLSRFEGLSLLRSALAFRFALPGRAGDLLERAQQLETSLVRRALAGKEMYVVHHPRPVRLEALYAAVAPFCQAAPALPASNLHEGHVSRVARAAP